jgi:hypothetical protein
MAFKAGWMTWPRSQALLLPFAGNKPMKSSLATALERVKEICPALEVAGYNDGIFVTRGDLAFYITSSQIRGGVFEQVAAECRNELSKIPMAVTS